MNSNKKKEGLGVQVLKDGAIYEGKYRNGKQQGDGRYISQNSIYCGQWENGKATGKGVFQGKFLFLSHIQCKI